ncbi:glycosyltransferase [Changpingibacter yushuensis]|uniref:glycosyltransferase n=1 Tax=Changpingibacter yushuensis TaxID=2758440 RepID=UPI0015F6224F|nr:glycosyltransferase [Changpingibacter yushuensis]
MTRVSVILVNFRGAEDSIAAAEYLRQSNWPANDLEIVIVDNDSGDGSFEHLLEALPDCVVVESGANLGFAGGCNFGVSHASGSVVAFLNNDARPDPNWISAAVAELEADPTIGCVASKVLDWDGNKIDYVDGSLTWFGMGYKREAEREDRGQWETPKDVLFPTGAAMFVPRRVYEELGGFDERFFMFYEDVDFGWRVNLAGYSVRYVPTSVAYHRHHVTMNKFGNFRETYLLERNALACLYKNLGTDLLRTVFGPAVALAVERSASQAEAAFPDSGTVFAPDATEMPKSGATATFGISYFVDILPSLAESRHQIQSTRKKNDAQILPLMRNAIEPAYPLPKYLDLHEKLVELFHIDQAFAGQSKILVVTGEPIAAKMAGPAIRAWEMSKRLAVEHAVRLCSTAGVSKDVSNETFEIFSGDEHTLRALTDWADIIIFQGFLLESAPWLMSSEKIVVADIYDPMHLEQLEQARDQGPKGRKNSIDGVTGVLNRQIARADKFLCASDKQRQFWLGQLAAQGRLNANILGTGRVPNDLIAICPFGLDEVAPVQTEHAIRGKVPGIGMNDKVIIWGGGVYNWFDPLSLIEAVSVLKDSHPDVRLYFLGMKHPNPGVPDMEVAQQALDLSERLGLTNKYVFFNHDWVPYNERQNYLLDANVGVSTHFEHIETQFSFRTRILDYLWAGLPIVATRGDSFGNILDSEGIGISVEPRDVNGLAAALEKVLYDLAFAESCTAQIHSYSEQFEWNNALQPLLSFCREPQRAADLEFMEPTDVPEGMLGFIDPGFDLKRDVKLAVDYMKTGGLSVLRTKVVSRLKKYI